jgi:hypothetical protein
VSEIEFVARVGRLFTVPESRGSVNQDLHSGLVIELAALYDVVLGPADHGNEPGRPTGGGGAAARGPLQTQLGATLSYSPFSHLLGS